MATHPSTSFLPLPLQTLRQHASQHQHRQRSTNSPRLVASSSSVVSTDRAAIRTYRTTDPRMKQFLTAICQRASCQRPLAVEYVFKKKLCRAWLALGSRIDSE